MIYTRRTIKVGAKGSTMDEPIVLYRGDREVEIEFTISGSKYMFGERGNVIESTNAAFAQLVIKTPNKGNIFSPISECDAGKVIFMITASMIDELTEVGDYDFQVRLYDEEKASRITIHPVKKGICINEPIATEDSEPEIPDTIDISYDSANEAMTVTGNGIAYDDATEAFYIPGLTI